jgi:hypothetical protein
VNAGIKENKGMSAIAEVAYEAVNRLSRDLAQAAKTLTPHEARFLVDAYYLMQENRIRSDAQIRAISGGEEPEPHSMLVWLTTQNSTLENQIKRALDKWTGEQKLGLWAKSITGIGPVIAAGLLAHVNIEHCPTAGHLWSFAGLNPEMKWTKGEVRPFNANLKKLCWKIGESFIKVQNNESDVYGKVYAKRKLLEAERNAAGLFGEQATKALTGKRFGKDTKAFQSYNEGRLPDGHIHARARRYAVKLFLAHYQEVAWWLRYGELPVAPYSLAYLGHSEKISPPNVEEMFADYPSYQPLAKSVNYKIYTPPVKSSEKPRRKLKGIVSEE